MTLSWPITDIVLIYCASLYIILSEFCMIKARVYKCVMCYHNASEGN